MMSVMASQGRRRRSRKSVEKVFSSSATMFVCFFPPNDTLGSVAVVTMACGDTNRCCFSRSPCVEGLRGGEAWRAGGDAGRSRASTRHEQLFARSAPTSVRTDKHLPTNPLRVRVCVWLKSCGGFVFCTGLEFHTLLCLMVTEDFEHLDMLLRISIII